MSHVRFASKTLLNLQCSISNLKFFGISEALSEEVFAELNEKSNEIAHSVSGVSRRGNERNVTEIKTIRTERR